MDARARLLQVLEFVVSDGCSEMVSVKGSEDEPRDDHRQSTSGGGLAATEAIPFTNPITGNQIKVYVNPKPGALRAMLKTPGPSGEACAHVIAVAGGNIAAARRRRITRTWSTRSATADIRLAARQAARRDSRMSPGSDIVRNDAGVANVGNYKVRVVETTSDGEVPTSAWPPGLVHAMGPQTATTAALPDHTALLRCCC